MKEKLGEKKYLRRSLESASFMETLKKDIKSFDDKFEGDFKFEYIKCI